MSNILQTKAYYGQLISRIQSDCEWTNSRVQAPTMQGPDIM